MYALMTNKYTLLELASIVALATFIALATLHGLKLDDERQEKEVLQWKAYN
jgi:hypothetical protein